MIGSWIKSDAARRGLLAVLMLAVLIASVGVAWLLDHSAAARARRGAQIVKGIRAKGLQHFWPEKLQIDWYIIESGIKTVGWSAEARVRTPEGNFIGVNMDVVPEQHSLYEQWLLNSDATGGAYYSTARLADGRGFKTDIFLADGKVKVLQHGTGAAHAPEPENYLPKGTLRLAVRQVADEQVDAQFAMVFNERPNPDRIIEFGTLRLRYLGRKQKQQGGSVSRVRLTGVRGGKKHSSIYELDEKGRILLVEADDGYRRTAVDEQAVKKEFENAPQDLRRALRGG